MFGNLPDELGASSACSEAVGISGSPQSTSQKKPQSTSQQIQLFITSSDIVLNYHESGSKLKVKTFVVFFEKKIKLIHKSSVYQKFPQTWPKPFRLHTRNKSQLQYSSHVRYIFSGLLICNSFSQIYAIFFAIINQASIDIVQTQQRDGWSTEPQLLLPPNNLFSRVLHLR